MSVPSSSSSSDGSTGSGTDDTSGHSNIGRVILEVPQNRVVRLSAAETWPQQQQQQQQHEGGGGSDGDGCRGEQGAPNGLCFDKFSSCLHVCIISAAAGMSGIHVDLHTPVSCFMDELMYHETKRASAATAGNPSTHTRVLVFFRMEYFEAIQRDMAGAVARQEAENRLGGDDGGGDRRSRALAFKTLHTLLLHWFAEPESVAKAFPGGEEALVFFPICGNNSPSNSGTSSVAEADARIPVATKQAWTVVPLLRSVSTIFVTGWNDLRESLDDAMTHTTSAQVSMEQHAPTGSHGGHAGWHTHLISGVSQQQLPQPNTVYVDTFAVPEHVLVFHPQRRVRTVTHPRAWLLRLVQQLESYMRSLYMAPANNGEMEMLYANRPVTHVVFDQGMWRELSLNEYQLWYLHPLFTARTVEQADAARSLLLSHPTTRRLAIFVDFIHRVVALWRTRATMLTTTTKTVPLNLSFAADGDCTHVLGLWTKCLDDFRALVNGRVVLLFPANQLKRDVEIMTLCIYLLWRTWSRADVAGLASNAQLPSEFPLPLITSDPDARTTDDFFALIAATPDGLHNALPFYASMIGQDMQRNSLGKVAVDLCRHAMRELSAVEPHASSSSSGSGSSGSSGGENEQYALSLYRSAFNLARCCEVHTSPRLVKIGRNIARLMATRSSSAQSSPTPPFSTFQESEVALDATSRRAMAGTNGKEDDVAAALEVIRRATRDTSDPDGTGLRAFGVLQDVFAMSAVVRILLTSNGFTIFFAPQLWHTWDIQVDPCLQRMDGSCWIADSHWRFIKMILTPEEMEPRDQPYMSADLEVRRKRVVQFINEAFLHNGQATPDSSYFSIGSYLDNPNMPRPFRLRLGGSFSLAKHF